LGKWIYKRDATPSTEQAYIEQLKMIAKEEFGEIKVGDRFNCNILSNLWSSEVTIESCDIADNWCYYKESDRLLHKGVLIYQQGKWATKLPERVKVIFSESYMNVTEFRIEWFLRNAEKLYNKENSDKISEYLSLKLDEYLNNEL
jgi:hypothetical protein